MDDNTLRDRAKKILSTLHLDDRNDSIVRDMLKSPARYLLVGEHPHYGYQYVWGFRHTLEEAATMYFQQPSGFGFGDLAVRLAYIYDLQAKKQPKVIRPGPVDRTVKIGRVTVSDKEGVAGQEFKVGDEVMVKSSGVSPVRYYRGTVVGEGRGSYGQKIYKIEYDPWGEGRVVGEIDALHVFKMDSRRPLVR